MLLRTLGSEGSSSVRMSGGRKRGFLELARSWRWSCRLRSTRGEVNCRCLLYCTIGVCWSYRRWGIVASAKGVPSQKLKLRGLERRSVRDELVRKYQPRSQATYEDVLDVCRMGRGQLASSADPRDAPNVPGVIMSSCFLVRMRRNRRSSCRDSTVVSHPICVTRIAVALTDASTSLTSSPTLSTRRWANLA